METLLKLLKANHDYLSGEEIARQAGITRAAIWKQVEQLREMGYQIDSTPRLGYRLVGVLPDFNQYEFLDGLVTNCFGKKIYYLNEIGSTNEYARRLALGGALEGTLVVAERQTAGRGRMGKSWASAPGLGLWLTLILRPKTDLAALSGLTILTAVALAKAIARVTEIQVEIKWPNDLVYQGRKLVGILAELKGEMDLLHYLLLGVGLNVNQQVTDFPSELQEKATSLAQITKGKISRRILLQEFLYELENVYPLLGTEGMSELVAYARKHSATLGREVRINQGFGRIRTGRAMDLGIDGSLWLREESDKLIQINAGEIIETLD